MGFRENLKNELEFQDIKTKELAERSGVNKRTIDHYLMTNPQEPSVSNAVKIAQALGVSVEYLVTGDASDLKTQNTKASDFICLFNTLSQKQKDAVLSVMTLFSAN